ncbi:C40 family peptidase [Streptosporangium sp. NPDC001559]|uniref:C40 family peptidase n=1 Tax=Streptosporangium sp. NPDC001559 TaxID=3366187 RepID=UPI0036E66859
MEGTVLNGKTYPRVLTLIVTGSTILATPAVALADSSLTTSSPTPLLALAAAGFALAHPAPTAENSRTPLTAPTVEPAPAGFSGTGRKVPAWKKALNWAMSKRGTPYVWGGTGRGGFDCSGLMLRAYGAAGIRLPRTTTQQYSAFARKISWKNLKPGDLVFFHNLGHVGMITKPGYMVHAPRSGDVVKVEKLRAWRRASFAGAVRPDPKGVELADEQAELDTAIRQSTQAGTAVAR